VRSHSKFSMYLTHFDSVANSDQRKIPTSFERINTKIKMECEDADGSVNPDQDADLDRDEIHRDEVRSYFFILPAPKCDEVLKRKSRFCQKKTTHQIRNKISVSPCAIKKI
jgi:hypothetical protein